MKKMSSIFQAFRKDIFEWRRKPDPGPVKKKKSSPFSITLPLDIPRIVDDSMGSTF